MLCYLIKSQVRPQQGRDECNCFTVQFFLRDFFRRKSCEKSYPSLAKSICQPFHNGAPKPADNLLHWNVMSLGCPKKYKSPNFGMPLTPVVFIG